jgi:hypothetical protein
MRKKRLLSIAFLCALTSKYCEAEIISVADDSVSDIKGWSQIYNKSNAFAHTWETLDLGASLSGNIATLPGQEYLIDFSVNLAKNHLNIYVNNKSIADLYDYFGFRHEKIKFFADSENTKISFVTSTLPNQQYLEHKIAISSSIDISAVAAVPEPETYALMAIGLLGLVASRKKTYKKT